jgi:hypothetical protein
MNNKLLIRAITALNDAGFEVVNHAEQDTFTFIGISHGVKAPVSERRETAPEPKEFGKGYKLIQNDSGLSRRPGETWDLAGVMDTSDWREALKSLRQMIQNGCYSLFNIGDFLYVSFEVPAAEHQGVKFGKLKIENAKVQIVEILSDRVIFNFDEILFESAINAADTNDGGMNYSLLTAHELFGKSEYWESKTNWNNGEQIPLITFLTRLYL